MKEVVFNRYICKKYYKSYNKFLSGLIKNSFKLKKDAELYFKTKDVKKMEIIIKLK